MSVFRICIVGAGPAGYFAAQALQSLQTEDRQFQVDMIEKLPTPWGLVRSGVAPDHPKIKTISKVFEKIATTEGFQLFCNVELGRDVTIKELSTVYDAVVLATGLSKGKKLGIPGEELRGSLPAAEFVPWYNAHPDFVNVDVLLDCDTAVVIGAGNVAMDVGRILALEPHELEVTDTALHALSLFHGSKIRNVHIFGRRGPEHAAFTSPELRELSKLKHTDVYINEPEILAAIERVNAAGEVGNDLKSNLNAMLSVAQAPKKGHPRSLYFHFFASPINIAGEERVEKVEFAVNEVQNGKVTQTSKKFSINAGLVVSAIGYVPESIPGLTLESGKIANTDGRIKDTNLYVVGWAKRGPSGVIGTNKSDAAEVMKKLVEGLDIPVEKVGIERIIRDKGLIYVSQAHWELINNAEVAKGVSLGKPRVKFTNRNEMLGLKG